MRESEVARDVRLVLQKLGVTLFRNTVGRFLTVDHTSGASTWVHAGLGVGSSDFIGWTEYVVKPSDVGRTVAVFTAIETKRARGGRKSEEQIIYVDRVRQVGGIAGFANSAQAAALILEDFYARR